MIRPFSFSLLLGFFYLSGCGVTPAHHQKFLDRNGRNLSVEVNGNLTEFTGERRWTDGHGVATDTTHWSVSSNSGALCFKVNATPEGFGEFLEIRTVLKEYRSDRESSRWKNYTILPYSSTGHPPEPVWLPGEEFCVEEFVLTHRLRYRELPQGTYLLDIHYNGEKNWDRQSIYLEVR